MNWFRRKNKFRGFRRKEIRIINKPVYENPYFQRKKPSFILRLLKKPKLVFLFLASVGLIYFFFFSKFFRLEKIDIQGYQELTYNQVREELNKILNNRRFIIFSQNNIFIFDEKETEKALKENLALKEIKIAKRLPTKITITLTEKIPNLTLMTNQNFYYLDLEGTVTHQVAEKEVKKNFPLVEDLNKRVVKLNQKVLPQDIVQVIIRLKENFFSKTNTNVEKFLIPMINCPNEVKQETMEANVNSSFNINQNKSINKNSNLNTNASQPVSKKTDCDLAPLTKSINLKTEEGWKVYFTINEDIFTQLERLKVYLLRKAVNKEPRKNLVYIDLRFGDKIYVKEQ